MLNAGSSTGVSQELRDRLKIDAPYLKRAQSVGEIYRDPKAMPSIDGCPTRSMEATACMFVTWSRKSRLIKPRAIRCDNDPELTSHHFLARGIDRKIKVLHIQPGKLTQNAYSERFHGRLREGRLQVSWSQNLFDARRKITAWRHNYNEQRPHSSLNYLTPAEFAAKINNAKVENAQGVSDFHTTAAAAG